MKQVKRRRRDPNAADRGSTISEFSVLTSVLCLALLVALNIDLAKTVEVTFVNASAAMAGEEIAFHSPRMNASTQTAQNQQPPLIITAPGGTGKGGTGDGAGARPSPSSSGRPGDGRGDSGAGQRPHRVQPLIIAAGGGTTSNNPGARPSGGTWSNNPGVRPAQGGGTTGNRPVDGTVTTAAASAGPGSEGSGTDASKVTETLEGVQVIEISGPPAATGGSNPEGPTFY